jgi:hypothetical protein
MDKEFKLTLHDAQWSIFEDGHRFRVACNGRRFGKTALGCQELIMASLGFQGEMSLTSPQMVIGALPTAVQARPILFKPLVDIFTNTVLSDLVEDINRSTMTIRIKGKPSIRIVGANDKNGDRLRGNRIYFILMDEVQDISPVVWTEVVRPAMSDTPGSRALFTGTPRGTTNFLYYLSENAKTDEEWSFHNYPTSANPCIPRSEIARAKASLPPRVYLQEYEANFVVFAGQIYSDLDSNNMVEPSEVPHCDLVVMGLDWGDRFPSAVVVGRESRSQKWYILDAWSPNTDGVESQPITRAEFDKTITDLVKKYKVHSIYCDPSRPSDILAVRTYGSDKGFHNCVAGFNGIQSGISQVANLIFQNKLLIVNKPESGKGFLSGRRIQEFLTSYHWETDKLGQVTEVPGDGIFSHSCDALRYALAYKGG